MPLISCWCEVIFVIYLLFGFCFRKLPAWCFLFSFLTQFVSEKWPTYQVHRLWPKIARPLFSSTLPEIWKCLLHLGRKGLCAHWRIGGRSWGLLCPREGDFANHLVQLHVPRRAQKSCPCCSVWKDSRRWNSWKRALATRTFQLNLVERLWEESLPEFPHTGDDTKQTLK